MVNNKQIEDAFELRSVKFIVYLGVREVLE